MTEISFLGSDSRTSGKGGAGGGGGEGGRGLVGAGRWAGGVSDYINSNEVNRALGMYTF